MAIDLNSPQYEHVPVNTLGKSDILLALNSGRLDYCKVTEISTAKPGKHGSAKFIIKAQNVLNGKGYEVTYVSGTKIVKVKLKRTEYFVVDIFGEEVFTQSTSDDSGDAPIFLKSQFHADDIAQLEGAFINRGSDEVTCMITSAPGLLMIESIRLGGKLLELERNK